MEPPAAPMHREGALARLRQIASSRAQLQAEIAELQAEEMQLRRFFRLTRRATMAEASSYQVVSIHLTCMKLT